MSAFTREDKGSGRRIARQRVAARFTTFSVSLLE
jgi:hypothetical protein